MASNANQNISKPTDNYVRKNGVIKEQVLLENSTRKSYDRKWGYMRTFNDICLKIANNKGISDENYKKMIEYKKGKRITSSSTWHILESGPPPIITSGEIGWRSSRLECCLEKLGPLYISPRHTLTPPGVEPQPKLTNIFLG